MHRNDAYNFIQLLARYNAETDVKLVDFDPQREMVEVQFASGRKRWMDYWYAAKAIEANCTLQEEVQA